MERSVLDDSRIAVSDGVRRRGTPLVYLVDAELKLMGATGLEGVAASDRWLGALQGDVRRLIDARLTEGLGARGDLVRVVPLSGEFAGYAIFVERRREPIRQRDLCSRFGLSPRECEVLVEVVGGLRTIDIANRLGISESTVETHVRNIGVKMDCSKRSAMVAKALAG